MAKVMIVEDECAVAEALTEAFQDAGFLVRCAEDGGSALLMLKSEKVDAIVTDLRMPTIDGLQLVRILRGHPGFAPIPVVMLSGYGSYDDMACEVDAFVVKPCRPQRLVKLVHDLVCSAPV